MFDTPLSQAVERFAQVTLPATEEDLERPWTWGSYDSEGVRFAMFRTYEELRELAARLAAERISCGQPVTSAQHILGVYHQAERDLEAAILGLDDRTAEQPPAEGQWPVQKAYAHLTRGDIGFYVLVSYALSQHRAGDWKPDQIPDEYWERAIGISDEEFGKIMHGPLSSLKNFHQGWHAKVIAEFQGIGEAELELPSMYWEKEPMPLRFRLHRFDSHLRQHTIQIDKTLVAIGRAPAEAQRLIRLIYNALAESESQLIGVESLSTPLQQQTAVSIQSRAKEIQSILQS